MIQHLATLQLPRHAMRNGMRVRSVNAHQENVAFGGRRRVRDSQRLVAATCGHFKTDSHVNVQCSVTFSLVGGKLFRRAAA